MSSICTPNPDQDDDACVADADFETWMVFVDPEAGARASAILALSYRQHLPLRAKETCFGLMIEGERAILRGFLELLHDVYPAGLYLKRRPFSIADTKVCARTFNTLGLRRAAEHFRLNNHS